MQNGSAINNENNEEETKVLVCEDYFIKLFPLIQTGLFTGINTAAASLGSACLQYLPSKFVPSDHQALLENAALGTALGFMLLGLICAYFFRPSKTTPRGRVNETVKTLYPLACADMMLSGGLPIATAYFIFKFPLLEAASMGACTAVGANLILIPLLVAAMFFNLGKQFMPRDDATQMHAPEPLDDMPREVVPVVEEVPIEDDRSPLARAP